MVALATVKDIESKIPGEILRGPTRTDFIRERASISGT
jgi:hypothetical protein